MSNAAVVAEYPARWVQFGVYITATGVSLMRVLGQEHLLIDLLTGRTPGWLIGGYVLKKHG